MKRNLLFLMMFAISGIVFAQETITGWTFPVNSGPDSLNANLGTTQNKTYDIRFEWTISPGNDSTVNSIVFTEGATTFAAATSGWDNGAGAKFWSAKFKANNYTNFKLSSKQKSDNVIPGPKDFKVQWRLSSTDYTDVPNGNVTVGGDWTSGVLTDLPVPITGQGTSSIYVRWIMTSNTDINGGTVSAAAQSMIDDVMITAVGSTGQNELVYTNRLKLYPTPNDGNFTLASTEKMESLTIMDVNGRMLQTIEQPSMKQSISLQGATPGVYLVKVLFTGEKEAVTARIVIE